MDNSENCARPKNATSNGTKATLGIAAVAALVGSVAAVILPMGERINSLERQLDAAFDRIEEQIADHRGLYGHPEAHSAIARLGEKFPEIEAQFDGLKNLDTYRQAAVDRRLAELEANFKQHDRQVTAQREKINALERGSWGQAQGAD